MSFDTSITFSQLPFELRTQIWEAALPGPRFVPLIDDNAIERLALQEETRISVQLTRVESRYYKRSAKKPIAKGGGYVRSTSSVPILLQVCAESRQVMQRCGYELAFGSYGFFGAQKHGPRIWFNFKWDVLLIQSPGPFYTQPEVDKLGKPKPFKRLYQRDLLRVKRLALFDDFSLDNYSFECQFIGLSRKFRCLEEIFVVADISGNEAGKPVRDNVHDPLGYVECNILEATARHLSPKELMFPKYPFLVQIARKFYGKIGVAGNEYFNILNNSRMEYLRTRRTQRTTMESELWYSVPRLYTVWLMTKNEARHLIHLREERWWKDREAEDLEEECGPILRSLSPFSAREEDAIAARWAFDAQSPP